MSFVPDTLEDKLTSSAYGIGSAVVAIFFFKRGWGLPVGSIISMLSMCVHVFKWPAWDILPVLTQAHFYKKKQQKQKQNHKQHGRKTKVPEKLLTHVAPRFSWWLALRSWVEPRPRLSVHAPFILIPKAKQAATKITLISDARLV